MQVFPANAGMIPIDQVPAKFREGVPRECGDDPGDAVVEQGLAECSPRMRG